MKNDIEKRNGYLITKHNERCYEVRDPQGNLVVPKGEGVNVRSLQAARLRADNHSVVPAFPGAKPAKISEAIVKKAVERVPQALWVVLGDTLSRALTMEALWLALESRDESSQPLTSADLTAIRRRVLRAAGLDEEG